jgi:hypothetical protein
MSEAIYQQVEDAIARKLHLGRGYWGLGPKYCYPIAIEHGDIIVRDSDCGLVKPTMTLTTDAWAEMVEKYGLWKKTGFWHFTPADDPAANLIRSANRSPSWAGHEIYELRKRVEALEEELETLRAPKS